MRSEEVSLYKQVRISDVCEVFDGPHATPKKTERGPVYLGIDSITDDGHINPAGFNHLSAEDFKTWTKRVVPQENDVVFTYEATLDRYNTGMVCTNFCRAIKPKPGYSMFVYYYWQYLYDHNIFFSYENGTTGIKNLDLNGFLTTEEIFLPPIDLVVRFDALCQTVFDEVFTNGLENERLATLRDYILPRLMSGEIDVSELSVS